MIQMKYSIDRIENNIAIIENITTGEKKEIEISKLPDNIKEGNILIEEENNYYLDYEEEEKRRKNIKSRFENLKKK